MTLRLTTLVLCALVLSPFPAAGQEAPTPTHVYEAYYKVSFADLEEWNRIYRENSVPILTELQAEGIIEGWTQSEHSAGGEYNIRQAIRTYDFASLDRFWTEYLGRLDGRHPADQASARRMIEAHHDEIWDVLEANPGDEVQSHIYAATFQVSFADMDEWNRMWSELAGPILAEAVSDDLISGWVRLGHNTGGPHNSKVLFLFEEWDDIDDLFETLLGRMAEEHPDEWDALNRMFTSHDDIIWATTANEAD